ncbi:hypothetical protein V5O48_000603 [Marasmius crinis-equi]|uniref:Uncharacterized protein n=1 Tax=Marasmius crinis-equi TaxID=585013 RepID=A0ABR3G0Z0_9AGAR
MSNIVNKIKDKVSSNSNSESGQNNTNPEPIYSIQPHPNPGSEEQNQFMGSNPAAAHHAKGPHLPSHEIRESLEKPAGRDELRARQEELNKGN